MTHLRWNRSQLHHWLREELTLPGFLRLVLSQPVPNSQYRKVKGRPVLLQGVLKLQLGLSIGNREHHQNLAPDAAASELVQLLESDFHRLHLFTQEAEYTLRRLPNGEFQRSVASPSLTSLPAERTHDRVKPYLLPEGLPIPFLVETGVMNAQGKVLAAKSHKFRQINRFLELVNDIVPDLPADRPIRVVDFGSGKSYLTFAVHYLLQEIHRRAVCTIGVDRNPDIIQACQQMATRMNCSDLQFLAADVSQFSWEEPVDLVLSLHACDTATDDVLAQAVQHQVPVILSAPCCQHELAPQLQSSALTEVLRHGILRERLGALLTDALRAAALEVCGYRTQVVEFVELEHTPKNLLLRAIRRTADRASTVTRIEHYQSLRNLSGISHFHLERLLRQNQPNWPLEETGTPQN